MLLVFQRCVSDAQCLLKVNYDVNIPCFFIYRCFDWMTSLYRGQCIPHDLGLSTYFIQKARSPIRQLEPIFKLLFGIKFYFFIVTCNRNNMKSIHFYVMEEFGQQPRIVWRFVESKPPQHAQLRNKLLRRIIKKTGREISKNFRAGYKSVSAWKWEHRTVKITPTMFGKGM